VAREEPVVLRVHDRGFEGGAQQVVGMRQEIRVERVVEPDENGQRVSRAAPGPWGIV